MADNSNIEWTDATWNPIRGRDVKTGTTVAIIPAPNDDLVERLMAKARSFAVVSEDGESVTYADGAILVEAAEEIMRLRRQIPKWQPIETAPKDTVVLICGFSKQGYYVADAKLINGTWWLFEPGDNDYTCESGDHTHWMPLPPPPAQDSEDWGWFLAGLSAICFFAAALIIWGAA
jgi:hypothetical protein